MAGIVFSKWTFYAIMRLILYFILITTDTRLPPLHLYEGLVPGLRQLSTWLWVGNSNILL